MNIVAYPPPEIENHLEWFGFISNTYNKAHRLRPNLTTRCRNKPIPNQQYVQIIKWDGPVCKHCQEKP